MNMLHRRWTDYRPGRLGKNAILGALGLGFRAVIQAVYLLLVSRWLGAEGYGWFSGAVALVILAAPLASWGTTYLIPLYISRDRSSSRAMWATALAQTSIIGSLLALLMLMIAVTLPQQPLPWMALLLLAVAELVLLPLAHAATSQLYALEHGRASAISTCMIPLGRVLAMLALIVAGVNASPIQAAFAHFVGSVLGLLATFMLLVWMDGWPNWYQRLSFWQATREGTCYALSNAVGTSYQEIDKILMLQILGATVAGTYALSFRVASIFVLPVSALIGAALPRLMKIHENGERSSRTFRVMLRVMLAYGVAAGIFIALISPTLPFIFGDEFSDSTNCILMLAPWPLLFALRQCFSTWLTASRKQRHRLWFEFLGLVLVTAMCALLMPKFGAITAIIAILIAEILVLAGQAFIFYKKK